MAKFYGSIGFSITNEIRPGAWVEEIVQKEYVGDIIRNTRRNPDSQFTTNGSIILSNQISIVSKDEFINSNFQNIVYVEWKGVKWRVTSIDIERPRLILSLGGVYGDQTFEAT